MVNFKYAMFLANTLYSLDISEEDFEEIGLMAWRKIGNKITRLYRYCQKIDCNTMSIELPCNVDIIESVTTGREDYKKYTHDGEPNVSAYEVEESIQRQRSGKSLLWQPGEFIKYKRVGDTLYFDKDYGMISILYKGVYMDEDELPFLSEAEAEAIAAYVAYTSKYKEAYSSANGNQMQLAQLMEQKWLKLCNQARIPDYINQNDMDKVLDVIYSGDRKRHRISFKPVK